MATLFIYTSEARVSGDALKMMIEHDIIPVKVADFGAIEVRTIVDGDISLIGEHAIRIVQASTGDLVRRNFAASLLRDVIDRIDEQEADDDK